VAFESLTEKFQNVFKNLRSKGKLNENDIKEALREVKLALLEADVNYKVVKDLIDNIKEKAMGQEVLESLTPGQHVIKIVNDELTKLMGSSQSKLTFSASKITVYMMVGLQGAGKTTTTAKLAMKLKSQGKKPLLVACDIYRPAAIKQLQVVGEKVNVPVFSMGDQHNPASIAKAGVNHAIANGNDIVFIDTAGRLHIDDELMEELENIKKEVKPQEILLVLDAMTGQDAVNIAQTFDEKLGIDGFIITKLDGDTRGGAALSVSHITKKPIKFVGMGEKLDELQEFYPDRMASRILGMGDILTLIEKAGQAIDQEKAAELEQKMRKAEFDLDDFLDQMQQIKKMGPLGQIMNMIPGLNSQLAGVNIDEDQIGHGLTQTEAIICSMTKPERKNPTILNGSRKQRIAKGSGTNIQEVNKLIKQFDMMKNMMKQFIGNKGNKGKMGKMPFKMPF